METINRIPIVMVSDENYVVQTKVAIWSMRKSTPIETILKITILCSAALNDACRQNLFGLQKCWPNLEINFYDVDENIFSGAKVTGHIPVASYYRLIIGEIIKEDKCIFLDGDMIINVDLNQLYSVNIEDVYIAGVKELGFLENIDKTRKHMCNYNFPTLDSYVNAGVMIFNLYKIRKDKLQNLFLREIKFQYVYMDQDILNKVCFGKIKLIDTKYNVPACHVRLDKLSVYLGVPVEQVRNEWKILHFIGGYKPWNNVRTWGAVVWWKYAKEVLSSDIWERWYSNALKTTMQSDWTYILKRCRGEENIVIVGYTDIAIDVYNSLVRCRVNANFFFCDNSREKQRLSNGKFIVHSVDEIVTKCPSALWINSSQVSFHEINNQLMQLGIDKQRILVYQNKSELYYEMLDETYKEFEYEQLRIKNLGE